DAPGGSKTTLDGLAGREPMRGRHPMVFEMLFVRQAYTQVLAHELKKIVRMLRAFPVERFDERALGCADSARDLAMDFVHHVTRIGGPPQGRAAHPPRAGHRSRGQVLPDLETPFPGPHGGLPTLPGMRWGDVVAAPAELWPCRQARRGELLWMALRELI